MRAASCLQCKPHHPAAGRRLMPVLVLPLVFSLAACSLGILEEEDGAPDIDRNIESVPNAVPRVEPRSKYGNPRSYAVNGKRYYTLASSRGYRERGIASWYGRKFHGRRTSSGEPYDMFAMTAAHKTLPLPTYARVTNLRNGRSVIVRINDRGPFHKNRIIDLSYAAAYKLRILGSGTGIVEVEAIDPRSPREPEVPRVTSLPTDGSFHLQVGAFVNLNNARQLHSRLHAADIGNAHISRILLNNSYLYRVRIGPIGNIEDADRLVAVLDAIGIHEQQIVLD